MIGRLLTSFASAAILTGSAWAQTPRYESHNRYTVKFICGDVPESDRHLLHKGNYRTTISIYNADFMPTQMTLQTSTMNPADKVVVGSPHKKIVEKIGPHGVQVIGCDDLTGKYQVDDADKKPDKPSGYGLLTITSKDQLDVTAVYTAAATKNDTAPATGSQSSVVKQAADVTSFTLVQPAKTRVRSCIQRAKIDLSDVANWETEGTTKPIRFDARRTRGDRDLEPGRRWMIYSRAGSNTDYSYFLKFCVCSGSGELKGDVRSDGASGGTLHAGVVGETNKLAELWPMQKQGNPKAPSVVLDVNSKPAKVEKTGDGFIEVKIGAGVGSSAISFNAELILQDGHAGMCQRF